MMSTHLLISGFVGFTSGILCRSFLFYPWQVEVFVLLLALIAFGAHVSFKRQSYLVIAMLFLCVACGSFRASLVPTNLPISYAKELGQEVEMVGVVIAEPDLRETSQRVRVRVEKEGKEVIILAVLPLYPEVYFGDQVELSGRLVRPEPFDTGGDRTFRYDRFLAKDGIFVLLEQGALISRTDADSSWALMMRQLLSIKGRFQEGLTAALAEPGASLASGLITGGKQGLGSALLTVFTVTGLVHIVVLSGYNVMIVAEAVLRFFGFLKRRTATILAGITIALFVLIAGAGAASIRAGLMAGLALFARATGRTYAALRALGFVAILMLLANPLLLAFDPGFQLSFVATLGLILGAPLVADRLSMLNSFWQELLAATIAAQVAVLPLLLYQTGLLSVISLPANILVLPAVPLAMALSALAGVVGALLPVAATFAGLPAHMVLTYILETATFLASLPFASITIPQFPFLVVLLTYAALGYVVYQATRMQQGALQPPSSLRL